MMIDQTGLTGTYDFTLQYALETGPLAAASTAEASDVETLGVAIQQQLGLKLESSKAPVDTIVIEHVEEPTAN
jgi:uncharacterized protein (TIGR03435 family)